MMYWFVGLSNTFSQFIVYYIIAYLITLNGNSLGLMLGSIILDEKSVGTVLPVVLLPLFLISGYFKNMDNLPGWVGWTQYLSPAKYCFSAWLEN